MTRERPGRSWEVWRAWGPRRPALPRTFPRHHVDPGQSGGLPGEKGSFMYSCTERYCTQLARSSQGPLGFCLISEIRHAINRAFSTGRSCGQVNRSVTRWGAGPWLWWRRWARGRCEGA